MMSWSFLHAHVYLGWLPTGHCNTLIEYTDNYILSNGAQRMLSPLWMVETNFIASIYTYIIKSRLLSRLKVTWLYKRIWLVVFTVKFANALQANVVA